MKISRFIHIYGDRVWNALTKDFLILTDTEFEFIKKYKYRDIKDDDYIPDTLLEKSIVISEKKEKELIDNLRLLTTDKQFQSLYLITSTDCNLACDYCFYSSGASNSLEHRQYMSFQTAKKALIDFKNIIKDNIKNDDYWQQVTFYGGEPLLNKQLLYQAIPYARNIFDSDTSLVINTNGILLEKSDINLFKEFDVEVQISLDGDKEIHDLHRKTHNGHPTYDIVINNIKNALYNGVKVLPMITATNDNIDNFSDEVYTIVSELGIDDYAVNVLITNSFDTTSDYSDKLAKEMLKSYEKFGDIASDYAFVELYNRLLGKDKSISKNSCGSSRKITVFPDGKVYACQAMEKVQQNYMNTIQDDYILNENWSCWRNRTRFDNDECLDCGCVTSCGGGCATGSYNLNGSIYDIDRNNCEYTKKLFKELHHI